MNKLFTLIFISISVICLGQSKDKQEVMKDTVFMLPQWTIQQFAICDTEIKRLQATTIEAEVQRWSEKKDVILTSFLADKVTFTQVVQGSLQLLQDKVRMKLMLPPKQPPVASTTTTAGTVPPVKPKN